MHRLPVVCHGREVGDDRGVIGVDRFSRAVFYRAVNSLPSRD